MGKVLNPFRPPPPWNLSSLSRQASSRAGLSTLLIRMRARRYSTWSLCQLRYMLVWSTAAWISCDGKYRVERRGKKNISKRVLCHARDQVSCQGTCSTMSKTVSWLCLILDCQVLDPICILCSASHIGGGRLKSLKDEIECNEELFILVSWEWLLWISTAPCLFAFFFPVFLVSSPLFGCYFFRVGCKMCCIAFPTYNKFLFSKSILECWNLWCLCTIR